jgi:hypothetical protein
MGLDMYLSKKTHVKNYNFTEPKDRYEITITKGGEPCNIDIHKVSEIIEEKGYWRKANQIHRWFVENVQDGVDDCKEYLVEYSDLQNLAKVCKHVLEHKADAEQLLPTSEGFFFGATSYDEYYYDELKETVEIIEGCDPNGYYYYQASW